MKTWQPTWWDDTHMSAWDRVREAMKRDWEQTKHDFGMKSGHYLHQSAEDTVKQVNGTERIPAPEQPNPPTVWGDWNDIELPVGYGYSAQARARASGAPSPWNSDVDAALRLEWETGPVRSERPWNEVQRFVRHGYEYRAG